LLRARPGLTIQAGIFSPEEATMTAKGPTPATSIVLLERLRQEPADQAAWAEFVRRYGPVVYRWCRRWHLQEANARDVTQAVLLKLVQKMRDFRYDAAGSFRAYLKTLAHYARCDLLASYQRPDAGTGDSSVRRALEAVEAGDDLAQRLDEQFDQELLAEAQARVQQRVEAHTWEAFRLTALEGLSGAEAAAQLGVRVATVFKAKSKVQKLLQEEIARLERPEPEDP
jgi:RNA polymerase sigma-70 factor (ECF subfamily)